MAKTTNPRVPIAIVGMGCRFAGDVTSPERLWDLLDEGKTAWSKIPESRFNANAFYHPNGERIGSTNVKGGHFIEQDVTTFDTSFFNMSSEVASCMDPQYRMMLEVVYESLENAGISMESIAGSNTSVYAGILFRDSHDSGNHDSQTIPRYFMTGNEATMAANRVSHFFDLRGPSMTVDTACSTTLTAIHLAFQSLRNGESNMSIVAGASLMMNPDVFISMSNLGFLSPDGMSYAFDSRANGYGRGEGVASLVLKRLDDAIRDGDAIRAVIAETALNNDGRTGTITAPDADAQERLIRSCYEKAGIPPSQTAYIEAHGTGTPTGDPLEVSAITAAFSTVTKRSAEKPLLVGSVKSNIGHTEAASGLASIIKVALMLEKGRVPTNGNFHQANPRLQLEQRNIAIPKFSQPWPGSKHTIRRASVNNFGFGGANAHAILERLDDGKAVKINGLNAEGSQAKVFFLSGKDKNSTREMASRLRDYLERRRDCADEPKLLGSLAYTLGSRRSKFPWSIGLRAETLQELIDALGDKTLEPMRREGNNNRVRLGWVFTGQGAQWYAMGRELIEAYPVFKSALVECDGYIREMGATWSIIEELSRDEPSSRVNEAVFSLPLSTAVQIALVRLLWSWGVKPSAVCSHSSGEAAAAFAAGALSCRATIGITYVRGSLTIASRWADRTVTEIHTGKQNGHYSAPKAKGAMMAAGLSRAQAEAYIAKIQSGYLTVACINSPSSVTISGDRAAVIELERVLVADKIFARLLKVTEAFHSEHMRPMAQMFEAALLGLLQPGTTSTNSHAETSSEAIIFASPKKGGLLSDLHELATPKHWVESMMQPVEFQKALLVMCLGESTEAQVDMIIEMGASGALGGPIRQIMTLPEFEHAAPIRYSSCLSRAKNALHTMHQLAIDLSQKGYAVDMDAVNFPRTRSSHIKLLTDLPTYPWNHDKRYWREARDYSASKQRQHPPHDLLGSIQTTSPSSAPSWRHVIRVSDLPWTRDHVVDSRMVYPGAGYVCMAVEAVFQLSQAKRSLVHGYALRDVEFSQALVIPDDDIGIETLLAMRPCTGRDLATKGWYEFEVHSVTGLDNWTSHCRGFIQTLDQIRAQPSLSMTWKDSTAYTREVDPEDLWAGLRRVGVCHGPAFQNLNRVQTRNAESLVSFSIADTKSTMPAQFESSHIIHPTTLDSMLQAAYSVLPNAGTKMDAAFIPRRLNSLKILPMSIKAGSEFRAHTRLLHDNVQSFGVDIDVVDASSSGCVLQFTELIYQSLGIGAINASQGLDRAQAEAESSDGWIEYNWCQDIAFLDTRRLQQTMKMDVDTSEIELMNDIRRCTMHYIQEALTSLTVADVAKLGSHYKKLYVWMKTQLQLASEGKLGPESARWLEQDTQERYATREKVAHDSANGELLTRLGQAAAAVLRGEIAPLHLMIGGNLLSRYNVDARQLHRSRNHVGDLVELCLHANPRARVLEIAGGNGCLTKVIFERLQKSKRETGHFLLGQYDFTDASSDSLEAARESFASWQDAMTFQSLNIEVNPADQGFENESYDVVVACQALNSTSSTEKTLRHVRSLLKPGGRLILVETTNDQLDYRFISGLLPDPWLSQGAESQLTPSLSISLLDQMLTECGWSGIDVEVRDCDSDDYHVLSTVMTTAIEEKKPSVSNTNGHKSHSVEQIVLLCGNGPSLGANEVAKIRSHLIKKTPYGDLELDVTQSTLGANVAGKYCILFDQGERSVLADPNMDESLFCSIVSMVTTCRGLLWVTRGGAMECANPWASLHLGFLRTLRNEYGWNQYVSLDLDPADPACAYSNGQLSFSSRALSAIVNVFAVSMGMCGGVGHYPTKPKRQADLEYAERDGVIYTPRAQKIAKLSQAVTYSGDSNKNDGGSLAQGRFESVCNTALRMDVQTPGLIDTLFFRKEEAKDDLSSHLPLLDDHIEIEPRAFGLNFRDVMVAMGQLEANEMMGFECAGIITNMGKIASRSSGLQIGDRVCALLRGHWATRTRTPYTSVVRIPGDLDFVQAASIPLVFATAYVALEELARLQRGETVLIHAGTGGVGQAAIMLAQMRGAEVFTTAGSEHKRSFLVEKFGIPTDHIFSSRSTTFADQVLSATGGKGVNVVLNSLAGTLLQTSFDCLAPFGRFIDIGKKDFELNSRLGMRTFLRNVTFVSVDLTSWEKDRGEDVSRVMHAIARLFDDKLVEPVGPITTYPISNIEKAFRLMQSGQHLGKIVITVDKEKDEIPVRLMNENERPLPSLSLKADATYLIVGGTGGIGRCLCEWLLARGARNLMVMSRSASRDDTFLRDLALESAASNINILPVACDVSDAHQLREAIEICTSKGKGCIPPIRGVIQAAAVLEDSLLDQMTVDNFQATIRSKVHGSWNLHEILGSQVDFFIMLSSLVGVMGAAGQANYAAGCTFQDALAQYRRSKGEPAVSIDFAMVKAGGIVAKAEKAIRGKSLEGTRGVSVSERLARLGFRYLEEDQVLRTLELSVLHSQTGVVVAGINTGPGPHWNEADWMHESRFAGLRYRDPDRASQTGSKAGQASSSGLQIALSQAKSMDAASEVMLAALNEKLATMFSLSIEDVAASANLSALGVDSLIAVELRNWIAAQAASDVSIFDLMQPVTLSQFSRVVVGRSSLLSQAVAT
ncbi:polyketide synthase [Xylariaceae sp. FL1651]|nr:polyketide synthase [Xylariaceae sp. FL1651]